MRVKLVLTVSNKLGSGCLTVCQRLLVGGLVFGLLL